MKAISKTSREERTIRIMIEMYCHAHHMVADCLCDDCAGLYGYALERIENCPFKKDKPACSKCTIHCYKPVMRERIRVVMRYSGPKMMHRHPVLGIGHLLDAYIKKG